MKKISKNNEKDKEEQPDYIGHRQRLKARFMSDGGNSMPDYEMLELLLSMAIPRKDTKPLAKALIKHYMNLANVLAAPPAELMNISGVGPNVAFYCSFIQACAKKICWANLYNNDVPVMTDKKRIVEYCRASIGHAGREELLVIFLDIHGRYLHDNIEQVGTIGSVVISPRDIVEKALLYKASKVIIAHNHPSGSCAPSVADIKMTKELKDALKTVQIELVDHIIISPREYYSMKDYVPFMNMR